MSYSLFGDDPPAPPLKFGSRDTHTPGQRFEAQVGSALIGFQVKRQHVIGKSFGGLRKHKVDFVVTMPDGVVLVSVKWQGTRGTGEEKVPHEVMRLKEAIDLHRARRAYVVLGGEGWTLREYFESTDFAKPEQIKIMGIEPFTELCNRRAL